MSPSDPEFDDLYGVDLSQLDLDHIELDEEPPASPVWRWLALLLLVALGGAILWFPTTPHYAVHGHSSWLFLLICGVAVITGIAVGRWWWTWVQDLAVRWARRPPEVQPGKPERPPSAARRWLTLLVVVGGMVAILVGLPAFGATTGKAISGLWFLGAVGAVVVGLLAGRWLFMQAEADARAQAARPPLRSPPWLKWVTLVLLIVVAAGALLTPMLARGSTAQNLEFALGGVGLAVGIGGAIWLARRVEEAEQRLRDRNRQPPGHGR
jgi:hypothetical protein